MMNKLDINRCRLRGFLTIYIILFGFFVGYAANNMTSDAELLFTSSTSANSGNIGTGDYFWLAANASFNNALTIDATTYYAANWKDNCIGFTLGDVSAYSKMVVKVYYAAKSGKYIKFGIGSWYNSITTELGSADGTGNENGLTATFNVSGSNLSSYTQFIIYSDASSSSDVRFAGCTVTFTSDTKTDVTMTLNLSSSSITTGDTSTASVTILDPADQVVSPASGDVTYTSSDTSVATVSGNTITGVATGVATITATYAGDSNYNSATATAMIRVTSSASWSSSVKTTAVKAVGPADLSTLSGTAMGLTTANTVNASDLITVYDEDNTVVRSSGDMTMTADDITATKTDGYWYLTSASTTTTGKLEVTWKPWDNYAWQGNLGVSCLTTNGTGDGTYDSSNNSITVSNSNTRGYVFNDTGGRVPYCIVDGVAHFFNYLNVQLAQPTTSANVQIAIEYYGGGFDYKQMPEGAMFLCVPINPNKNISKINIGTASGTETLYLSAVGFSTAQYYPCYGEVNGIVVSSTHTMLQTNVIYYNDAEYDPNTISFDNVYDAINRVDVDTYSLGTVTHNGKTYVQVPYDHIVKVTPKFTDASTSEVLTPDKYNCTSASFDTDAEDELIVAFTVGNNSTNKGVVTPLTLGYGDVAISASLQGYNSTSQRTPIVIVKAAGKIRNPTGGLLREAYSGTALGLTTKNSVDLDGKFKVFDANGNDITSCGTFTYESSSLTVSGSTVFGRTATKTASVKIIWTPDAANSVYYEAIHGTLYDIEVIDPSAGYYMELNPLEITLTEGDSFALSNISVEVTNDDSDVTSGGTITYSVASADQGNIEISGADLLAKLSDTSGNRKLSVTWTNNSDNSIDVSKDIKVYIKKRVAIALTSSPSPMTLTQGDTGTVTVTVFNDIDGDGVQDAGEETITDITPTVSVTDFMKASANNTAYLRLSQADADNTYNVTALNAGKTAGVDTGTATVTVKSNASTKYGAATSNVTVTVNDNTLLDYMGWDLKPGKSGTLTNAAKTQDYIHWRFGAPDIDEGVYVFRFNKPSYSFKAEVTQLRDKIHNSESSFDPFYETHLTDTKRTLSDNETQIDAKGDAFLEYNGMVAGYGTELGGRYMTPISGTFVRIEAEYDGVVTVRIRHNGSIDTSDITKVTSGSGDSETLTGYKNIKQARRALFVLDENGVVMPRTTNYATLDACGILDANYRNALKAIDGTYARISSESKVNSTFDIVNLAYTKFFETGNLTNTVDGLTYTVGASPNVDFSQNAFHFCRNYIYNEYGDANATQFLNDIKGGAVQRLFYSDEEDDVSYKAASVDSKTYFFSKYGYEVLSATHLVISFPVKAGKTYFVAANKSKIGMCSVEFEPASSYSTTSVTLDENATAASGTNSWLLSTADGTHLNVTLNRTFVPYRWHPLILPFSVSETQLRSIFGQKVSVIALDGGLRMLSSMNNYASRDGDFYDTTTPITGGTGRDGVSNIPFNGSVIKDPAIKDGSVTFTHHWYQMIYANCPVFLWFDGSTNVVNPTFNNVTFQRYTKDKTDEAHTDAIAADYSVTFPYKIDRQIGDGAAYNYVMKASYVATTPTYETYYVTNEGSGKNTTARIYHAKAGSAPQMKGMRVWIEPVAGSRSEPLRFISMRQYTDDEIDSAQDCGICDVIADEPIESMLDDDNVYDLMGRIVARGCVDGLNPGIYIHRGSKYYIR